MGMNRRFLQTSRTRRCSSCPPVSHVQDALGKTPGMDTERRSQERQFDRVGHGPIAIAVATFWGPLICMVLVLIPTMSIAKEYVIQRGDSLIRIAQTNGCTLNQLKVRNNIAADDDRIDAGDRILVNCQSVAQDARPRAGSDGKRTRRKGKRSVRAGRHPVNSRRLKALMRAKGFKPPKDFRALVVEVTLKGGKVWAERSFDYGGRSGQAHGWNPGSTVKAFAAIGALERIQRRGFDAHRTHAIFHHYKTGKRTKCLKRSKHCTVGDLVKLTLTKSNNIAYNRLAQLADYPFLNGRFLSRRRGFKKTGLHLPFERSAWIPLTGSKSYRETPKTILKMRGRKRTLGKKSHRVGKRGQYSCPQSGMCTTLQDLAEMTRRLWLHEQLPASDRFPLSGRHLKLVRDAMSTRKTADERRRGLEFIKALKKSYGRQDARFMHKPGFAGDWFSDVVYVYLPKSKRRWIVVAAGYPGRDSLTSAGRALGKVLREDNF